MVIKSFKNLDDIEKENREKEREEGKEQVANDIKDIFDKVLNRPKPKPTAKKIITTLIVDVLLLLVALDIFLGSIWLIKFFIKSLFGV